METKIMFTYFAVLILILVLSFPGLPVYWIVDRILGDDYWGKKYEKYVAVLVSLIFIPFIALVIYGVWTKT